MTTKNNEYKNLASAKRRISFQEREIFTLKQKINKLQLELGLSNKEISQIEYKNISETNLKVLKLRSIIESKFNIDISKRDRKRERVHARHLFNYWLCYYTDMSLTEIGDIFGYDHSSVCHSRNTINDLLDVDKQTVRDYSDICHQMRRIYDEKEIVINPS